MTNELEKRFFDTFGIESKKGCTAYDKFTEEEADIICDDHCRTCLFFDDVYPRITNDMWLSLVLIVLEYRDYPKTTNKKNIKERTLRHLIRIKKYFKDTHTNQGYHNGLVRKVRTLFKEK